MYTHFRDRWPYGTRPLQWDADVYGVSVTTVDGDVFGTCVWIRFVLALDTEDNDGAYAWLG